MQSNKAWNVYSTNGAGAHGFPFGKKEPRHQPYVIYTINFKMDHSPKNKN